MTTSAAAPSDVEKATSGPKMPQNDGSWVAKPARRHRDVGGSWLYLGPLVGNYIGSAYPYIRTVAELTRRPLALLFMSRLAARIGR